MRYFLGDEEICRCDPILQFHGDLWDTGDEPECDLYDEE
jgi:hypothetical protein